MLNTLNVYFLDHGKYFSFNAKEATEDIKMIETIQLRVKFKISMVPWRRFIEDVKFQRAQEGLFYKPLPCNSSYMLRWDRFELFEFATLQQKQQHVT